MGSIDLNWISIALALFFGLFMIAWAVRGFRVKFIEEFRESFTKISGKMDEIIGSIKSVPKMSELVTRLDERTKNLDLKNLRGTAHRTFGNIGTVTITADPGEKITEYHLDFERPLFEKEGFFRRESKKKIVPIRKKMFSEEVKYIAISASRLYLLIPSTNSKDCAEFTSIFLKWLDSDYWESLKTASEFEELIIKE